MRRTISIPSVCRCYKPCCQEEQGQGTALQPEEIELIRLIDLEGLEQEEAAERPGVSRKTVWRDLHDARRKIADALVNGKGITMAGCTKAAEGQCPKCPTDHTGGMYVKRIFSDSTRAGPAMPVHTEQPGDACRYPFRSSACDSDP